MTKDEILQRVKEHFQEGGIRDDGSCAEYYGDLDAFVSDNEEWVDGTYMVKSEDILNIATELENL